MYTIFDWNKCAAREQDAVEVASFSKDVGQSIDLPAGLVGMVRLTEEEENDGPLGRERRRCWFPNEA